MRAEATAPPATTGSVDHGQTRAFDGYDVQTRRSGIVPSPRSSKAMSDVAERTSNDPTSIRPFQVNIPGAELTELRRRINATRWTEGETVTDASQGVQLAGPVSPIGPG